MDAVKASGEDNNAKLIAAYFRQAGRESRIRKPERSGAVCDE